MEPTATPVESNDPLAAARLLYTGSNPVRMSFNAIAVEINSEVLIQGSVFNRDKQPLSGVKITIKDHPELGQTMSRIDGVFALVTNGGENLTVNYEKEQYLPAQRTIALPSQDFVIAPDTILLGIDPQVTTIALKSNVPQIARGSVVNDKNGIRQATLYFPENTDAVLQMPNGSTRSLTNLNIHATEYTAGEIIPNAIPAEFPTQSFSTYCVELSAEEAVAAGAKSVLFSQTVYFYVENFFNFPVGSAVPSGYYDREKTAWVPSPGGLVLKVIGITDEMAELDIDGSGNAADVSALTGLNITDNERKKIADLYYNGQSFYRVPIEHMTPWSCH